MVKRPAAARELHPGPTPLEQRRLQLVLEVVHLAAERGLGDTQARGRAREVQFLGHRDEVAQMPQFHAPSIPGGHGPTKEQSIGRTPPAGLTEIRDMMHNPPSTLTETRRPPAQRGRRGGRKNRLGKPSASRPACRLRTPAP